MAGTLFIISTPIGNLEDITFRAVETLKSVDVIAAEDTRRAGILLARYGIKKETISFHAHSKKRKTAVIIDLLNKGKNVGLISDSGTPGISDPGYVLIRECVTGGIPITVVPGPTALIAGLVLSGKPTHNFVFEGFLSSKSARRKKELEKLAKEERTVVIYEAPHRIEKLLGDFLEIDPKKEIVLAREITKKFEEVKRGTAGELLEQFKTAKPRGEFVVIF